VHAFSFISYHKSIVYQRLSGQSNHPVAVFCCAGQVRANGQNPAKDVQFCPGFLGEVEWHLVLVA
jgi:hypothetical protein